MIRYRRGNLFDSGAEALVNPVNCVGAMGAGLAKQFWLRFPEIQEPYLEACADRRLRPGSLTVTKVGEVQWVINFPTKDHFKEPSQLLHIERGMRVLREVMETYEFKSIAIPMLGCGLGGLQWEHVRPVIVERMRGLGPEVDVMIYGDP